MKVKFSLLCGGYCTSHRHMVLAGAPHGECKFPALVGLIEHPERGPVLFDTGYTSRFFTQTRSFPASLYAMMTPVFYQEEDAIANQLLARGIDPKDVGTVILSHFHADHVAGAQDFPRARFLYYESAYQKLKHLKGFAALKHAFLPGLLPKDFEDRAIAAERLPGTSLDYHPFVNGKDLFGDGTVVLVDLPGHAYGHYGAFINAEDGAYFMVADACWLSEAYRKFILPHPFAQFIFPDKQAYKETLHNIHQLHQLRDDIQIIPAHCEEVWDRKILNPR